MGVTCWKENILQARSHVAGADQISSYTRLPPTGQAADLPTAAVGISSFCYKYSHMMDD